MNTEEAIDFIKNEFVYMSYVAANYHHTVVEAEMFENSKKRVIELLQRGEKYEEMWGWLDNSVNANGMEYNRKWKKQVGNIMADIEQKYFPKGGNQ